MCITKSSTAVKNIVIVGAGIMGSGIAMMAAATGHNVTLVYTSQKSLEKARAGIENNADRFARKKFKDDPEAVSGFVVVALSRITYSASWEEAIARADLVIEAIVEDIEAKKDLFKKMDAIAPPHVLFASNTSSLSIAEMSSVTSRPDRFAGLHFFNPVPVMELIEVIKTDSTSSETLDRLVGFGQALGKTCITCQDTPGFIVNRLLFSLNSEALRMVERGDASVRNIDAAMKLGLKHPVGPFELMDLIGLDVVLSIMKERHVRSSDDPATKPSVMLETMVAENKLGVKTGEGFYSYK